MKVHDNQKKTEGDESTLANSSFKSARDYLGHKVSRLDINNPSDQNKIKSSAYAVMCMIPSFLTSIYLIGREGKRQWDARSQGVKGNESTLSVESADVTPQARKTQLSTMAKFIETQLSKTISEQEQGHFRRAGSDNKIATFQNNLNADPEMSIPEDTDIHTVTNAYKRLIREHIFNNAEAKDFKKSLGDLKELIETKDFNRDKFQKKLSDILAKLDPHQREIFDQLISLCRKTADKSKQNLMGADQLGIVFGPSFAPPSDKPDEILYLKELYGRIFAEIVTHYDPESPASLSP